jgi:endonuclease/exonuclease/phosphatase family metal-dependent hydrolase
MIAALAALSGGWYALIHGHLGNQSGPSAAGPSELADAGGWSEPIPDHRSGAMRIGSYNIQVFGESKIEQQGVVEILVHVARRFDVMAIQEVRTKNPAVLRRFVEAINSNGRRYDYVLGPRLGRTSSKEQYAFVFDTERVEIDREAVYTVDDPDDLLHREPLVGAFRSRAVSPERAFTFTLVNVHTDPDEVKAELNVLDDVFRAVQRDGRNEDDVIMLGDFNADASQLGELSLMPELLYAINGVPTNTKQTHQYDNIVFLGNVTSEFTGRSGVVDIMREFNLTMNEALEVSDHVPVWAEFSVYESGRETPVAARPQGVR